MTYLFSLTVYYYNNPVQYRISQIGLNEYYAESADKKIERFTLKKCSGVWISKGGVIQWQAAQVGEKIDKAHRNAINN
ncbi:MAG: hypothetical protein ABIN89_29370 [Chitinophagaceae bacterium]